MFKKFLKALDYSIIIFSLALFIIGIVALYSANGGADGNTSETMKQVVWMLVGVVMMIVVISADYKSLRSFVDTYLRADTHIISHSAIYRAY